MINSYNNTSENWKNEKLCGIYSNVKSPKDTKNFRVFKRLLSNQRSGFTNAILYNKNVKRFAKISFVVRRNDFSTPFDVIMIYTKQSTPSAVDYSKIAAISLSLKWRQRASVSSNRSQFSTNENSE